MMRRLVAAGALIAAVATIAAAADECCDTCLNRFAPTLYDASNWQQCSTAPAGSPGCCFCDKVQTIALPSMKTTMTAGTTQFITWPGVSKVTWSMINPGDETKPFLHPKGIGSPFSQDSKGNYIVCMDNPGMLLIRGWGPEVNKYPNCTLMSTETKITVTAALNGATCAGSSAEKPGVVTPAPGPTDAATGKLLDCDPVRGAFINGVCTCVADYSNPPACNGSSSWKLILSICGGIAAVLSIGISVRQILLMRKKKAEEREREEAMSKIESVEVMNVTHHNEPDYYDADRVSNPRPSPAKPYRSPARSPASQQPYPVNNHKGGGNMSPRQSREYTL
ncbi:Aste57867_15430 [Aphanomyces stellatus]|uniref:Aste57867_15430 protein n=1 Tax=Aphanomyces stellatus TaxID=120398 RepID=A0A485L341_9STRA|nr:hypothetical protein As57867_015374 [Aphanomyces stellatus]VFT92232.1 Aste57867_15430 [Aphanomyces stellatus]